MNTDTLPSDPRLLMRSIIQRIATGPDLSKDISRTEAHLGTKAIIDNVIDLARERIDGLNGLTLLFR